MRNKEVLISKLNSVTKGSRELDVATFLEAHETHYWMPSDINERQLHRGSPKDRCVDSFVGWEKRLHGASDILHYTTSLNDVMTLPGAEDLLLEAVYNVQRMRWCKGSLAETLALEVVRLWAATSENKL